MSHIAILPIKKKKENDKVNLKYIFEKFGCIDKKNLRKVLVRSLFSTSRSALGRGKPAGISANNQSISYLGQMWSNNLQNVEMIQHNKIVILLYTNISCFIKLIYA